MSQRRPLFALVPPLVGAILLFLFGSSRTDLTCDRTAGTCEWRDGMLGGDPSTFAIGDVREVRYVGGRGKHGNDGQVELALKDGTEHVFGKGDDDDAKATSERARAFFAGQGPVYRYQTAPRTWMYFLAGGLLLGAIVSVLLVLSRRRISDAERTRAAADPVVRKRAARLLLVGMGFFTLAVGGSIVSCVTSEVTSTGTLVLECKTGCTFAGGACAPGKTLESELDVGTHTIELASGAKQSVKIGARETTTFVCQ